MSKKFKTLDQYMSATEAAELVGIRLETFTAYVNRGYAPKPVGEIGGRRLYDRAEIEAWAKTRPNRGE